MSLLRMLTMLDEALKSLFKLKTEIIICGDFNIDYLTDNYKNVNLIFLLNSYNLFSTRNVDFPTRISNTSKSAIDNIFIDY
jgi:endonuclease/exonuclease/phosphatase family metal-dependent hydrolase